MGGGGGGGAGDKLTKINGSQNNFRNTHKSSGIVAQGLFKLDELCPG